MQWKVTANEYVYDCCFHGRDVEHHSFSHLMRRRSNDMTHNSIRLHTKKRCFIWNPLRPCNKYFVVFLHTYSMNPHWINLCFSLLIIIPSRIGVVLRMHDASCILVVLQWCNSLLLLFISFPPPANIYILACVHVKFIFTLNLYLHQCKMENI